MTEGPKAKLEDLDDQRAVLAEFGGFALKADSLQAILQEACRLVGRGLHVELAKIMELQPDGATLLARAGVGWDGRPDVVVADYRLREGRNGSEAILRVREAYGGDVPGILLTGETGSEAQHDAAAHRLHLIHKPVTPRQLGEALEAILHLPGAPPR